MVDVKKIVRGVLWKTGFGKKAAALFWNKVESDSDYNYLYRNFKNVFDAIPTRFADKRVSDFIEKDSKKWSKQQEYVLEIPDVIVEPERCIGIKDFNNFIGQTTIINSHYPFIFPYLLKRWTAKKIPAAVLYDGYATRNYFHHLLNAVNSIHMLEKVTLPKDIPFIINRVCFENKFFQYLYNRSEKFRAINWRVQEADEWLDVKKLYRLKCIHFDKEPWLKTLQLYNITPKKSYRKVFLSRDSKLFNRCLSNESEVAALLAKYGFETVYAEHLTMDEQVDLFQTTEYLVAIHGAGLVQQVFMNPEKARIIEILPEDYIIGLYYWEAYTLGMKYYDVIVGSEFDEKKNFSLDLNTLETAVKAMMADDFTGKKYGLTTLS